MIILDTNVISELMREKVDPRVPAWLDTQAADRVFLTAVNLSELLTGLELIPPGKRKRAMRAVLQVIELKFFSGRVLPYDESAARVHALLHSRARSLGQAISFADGQIAAIAQVQGYAVATRDTAPFEAAGVAVINPWEL